MKETEKFQIYSEEPKHKDLRTSYPTLGDIEVPESADFVFRSLGEAVNNLSGTVGDSI